MALPFGSRLLALLALFTITALCHLPCATHASGVLRLPFEQLEPCRHSAVRQGRGRRFDAERIPRLIQKFGSGGGTLLAQSAPNSTAAGLLPNVVRQQQEDSRDIIWVGYITIGTPEQTFAVQMDTGSANLWIPDVTVCASNSQRAQCRTKHLFFSSNSSTYVANGAAFSITYGSGYASGILGTDTVRIGAAGTPQIVIPATTFGQARNFSPVFYDWPIDGVFGLAYQALAVDDVVPPLASAINASLLEQPLFMVWLATDGNTVVNQTGGGMITFGGLDTSNCGSVIGWVALSEQLWFQFTVDSINVGTNYTYPNASKVISDTGTSLLYGPATVVSAIAAAVNASFDSTYGAYLIPCAAQFQAVTFTINGWPYSLTSKVLILDIGLSGGQCEFAMMALGGEFGIDWIIGDPFIRQYCTIYDVGRGRLGFAPALGLASTSSINVEEWAGSID